jgi:hypothetical protein
MADRSSGEPGRLGDPLACWGIFTVRPPPEAVGELEQSDLSPRFRLGHGESACPRRELLEGLQVKRWRAEGARHLIFVSPQNIYACGLLVESENSARSGEPNLD